MSTFKEINILLLGPKKRNEEICKKFHENNINYYITEKIPKISEVENYTHLITSGFHLRVPELILRKFPKINRLNLHATFLPFGKGIGTALFALIYPVTIGSSIHILEEKFDSGEIILQEEMNLINLDLTQRELYELWINHTNNLFLNNFESILLGKPKPKPHNKKFRSIYLSRDDSEIFLSLFPNSWDTKINEIKDMSLLISLRYAYILTD